MDQQIAQAMESSLLWLPQHGYGYYPVAAGTKPYDVDYFAKYAAMANTPIGKALNRHRVEMVNRHTLGTVLDIGIGCGTFIETRNATGARTLGYDVNPAGIAWLKERGLWLDWTLQDSINDITLWDVLEHLPEPHLLLNKVRNCVFVSIPIFRDGDHACRSKHLKPDEHLWMFTGPGLIRWMDGYGFDCVEHSDAETRIGREDIGSFVFRRRM